MAEESDRTQRKIYVLPTELVERISEYQRDKGLPSEVEAVRRLLDEALMHRDTSESITRRFLSRLAVIKFLSDVVKEVLVGHPLIRSLEFPDHDSVDFKMSDGTRIHIHANGSAEMHEYVDMDEIKSTWDKYTQTFGNPERTEIPF